MHVYSCCYGAGPKRTRHKVNLTQSEAIEHCIYFISLIHCETMELYMLFRYLVITK